MSRLTQTLVATGTVPCATAANPKPDEVKQMSSCTTLRITAASLFLVVSAVSAAPLHKCTVNGTVTYQQIPCPSDEVRKTPTIQELNAASKKKRESAASAPAQRAAPANLPAATGFSCDGRTFCSQMKSCAEAKYFLANCPGAKMDGDKNGIPCEIQWCSR